MKPLTFEMNELIDFERCGAICPAALVREAILAEVFLDSPEEYRQQALKNREVLSKEEKEILTFWETYWNVVAF